MNYLIGTNILIYLLCNPTELSYEAKRILTKEKSISVSIVSLWEIAIKQSIGKLNIKLTIPQIEKICLERDVKIIPINAKEIENVKLLPMIHRDPFDRLIISQAQNNDMCLITRDATIPKYDITTVW